MSVLSATVAMAALAGIASSSQLPETVTLGVIGGMYICTTRLCILYRTSTRANGDY